MFVTRVSRVTFNNTMSINANLYIRQWTSGWTSDILLWYT